MSYTVECEKEFALGAAHPRLVQTLAADRERPRGRSGDEGRLRPFCGKAGSAATPFVLALDMPPRRIYADARVRADAGCVALARGPGCLLRGGNGQRRQPGRAAPAAHRAAARVPRRGTRAWAASPVLQAEALRLLPGDTLYRDEPPAQQETTLTRRCPTIPGRNRAARRHARVGAGNDPARPGGGKQTEQTETPRRWGRGVFVLNVEKPPRFTIGCRFRLPGRAGVHARRTLAV